MTRFALLGTLLLGAAATAACRERPRAGSLDVQHRYIGPELTSPTASTPEESERRQCEQRVRAALTEPEVPGVPAFDANRMAFLARVKTEPVLFTRAPTHPSEPVNLTVQGYRQMLASGENGYGVVARLLAESAELPKQARDVLLPDGYLYAETPELGAALVAQVQPHQLFGHERIWIQRGDRLLHAERRRGRYYYLDGPLEGHRVRLLLFDRAGSDDSPPGPALHRDLRALRYRLHFDRMQITRVTESHVVANLRYDRWWVPTLLVASGPSLSVECEVVDASVRASVEEARAAAVRREHAVQGLRHAMLEELDEALPFDEPLHEYGFQMDGLLRRKWATAYRQGRTHFAVTGDRYEVFDTKGRPLAPQVCVDFLTDTFERAGGTWYRPRGEPPGRIVGKLDFDAVPGVDRLAMRRAPGFIAFARSHPEWFDVLDVDSGIPLGERGRFYPYLVEHADDLAPGDAVLIKGKTPWDARHVHFHSFFVYDSDPVTGMPLVVVGNAGRPSLRAWETEVKRTPERAIVARIRPRTEWIESILAVSPLDAVPPLAAGPE